MITLALPELTEMKIYLPKELPEKEGVYFIRDVYNSLIYIGMSKNIKQRIHSHLLESGCSAIKNKKEIVFISYILKKDYEYDTEGIERIYIDFYKPKYNNIKSPEIWEMITPEMDRQLTEHVPMR